MSQENVEVARRSIEGFNSREFDAVFELWDAEGEWIPAMAGAVDSEVYRGHVAFRRYYDELFESFSEVRVDDVELKDLGSRVLVLYKLSVRGRDSGVAVDQPGAVVYQLRGGKIVHGRSYLSHGEALKAVGLEG
jgi:ketosteroid isomerase-like protein